MNSSSGTVSGWLTQSGVSERSEPSKRGALTESQEVVKLHADAKLLLRHHRPRVPLGDGALEHQPRCGLHADDEGDGGAARLRGRGEDEARRREPQALDEREHVLCRHDVWRG
jgi:hypothetical protein